MANLNSLTKREREVFELLLQGKSNRQIALALNITEHTVEFHLKNIYAKLGVSSRGEAISLGISLGYGQAQKPGESAVADGVEDADNDDEALIMQKRSGLPGESRPQPFGRFVRRYWLPVLALLIAIAGLTIGAVLFSRRTPAPLYARECEYPDSATVGQMISRSQASALKVHGQFGSAPDSPWPALAGYVQYNTIRTPAVDTLYLALRYSKDSPASATILVYLDDEPQPRAAINPIDQRNWNQFTWTEPVFLGKVTDGLHSIKFSTEGQQYGVVDLDKFILTTSSP
jgi:DNA-binding CsgD family transcriptional regulator